MHDDDDDHDDVSTADTSRHGQAGRQAGTYVLNTELALCTMGMSFPGTLYTTTSPMNTSRVTFSRKRMSPR